MSLHPPAPSDVGELVEAYAQTVQHLIDLGRTMRPDDANKPTDCPGWTVLDQLAHVASLEAMVAGEPEPDVDISHHTHVRHAVGAKVERYVESRRGRDLEEVLDELEERLGERLAFYRSGTEWAEREVSGPFGPTTWGDLLAIRTFDIWVHEQDVREALARPGGLDSGAAALAVSQLFAAPSSPATRSSSTSPAPPSGGPVPGSRSTTARRAASPWSPATPRSTPTSSPPR